MDFQTPPNICQYMVQMIPNDCKHILEPTPGKGNLVGAIEQINPESLIAPRDFYEFYYSSDMFDEIDCVVMNPPFSPMKVGYDILGKCMFLSDNVIALMPWLTIINSKKRTKAIMEFGLVSVTHLPRNAFKGSRVQTCILQLQNGFNGKTEFKNFDSKSI